MKKRTLLLITALTIAVFASACGGKTEETAVEDTEAVMETEAVAVAEEPEMEEEEAAETEESETEEVAETEEPVTADEEETAGFSVTDLSATMYASGSVAVRKGPSTDYDRIGALSVNQKVTVTGQADSGWYRIEYQGEEAYVSNKYLSEKETVSNTASAGMAAAAGTEGSSVASQGTTSQETASQGTSSAGNTTAAPSGSTSTAGTTTPAQTATETTAGSAPAQDNSSAQNTPSADNSNTSGRADIDWNNPDEVLEYFEQTKDQVERVGEHTDATGTGTYVAVDGTAFSTSEECDEYERYLESIGYWD